MTKCPHSSFAIVIHEDNTYSLHCYQCRINLPFFFYTEKEWMQLGKGDAE